MGRRAVGPLRQAQTETPFRSPERRFLLGQCSVTWGGRVSRPRVQTILTGPCAAMHMPTITGWTDKPSSPRCRQTERSVERKQQRRRQCFRLQQEPGGGAGKGQVDCGPRHGMAARHDDSPELVAAFVNDEAMLIVPTFRWHRQILRRAVGLNLVTIFCRTIETGLPVTRPSAARIILRERLLRLK